MHPHSNGILLPAITCDQSYPIINNEESNEAASRLYSSVCSSLFERWKCSRTKRASNIIIHKTRNGVIKHVSCVIKFLKDQSVDNNMLLYMLPEVQDMIFNYCSLKDLKNLSLTSSAYNQILKEMLFHTIRIHASDVEKNFFVDNSKTKRKMENLKYTKVVHFYVGSVMSLSISKTVSRFNNLTELNLSCVQGTNDENIDILCECLSGLKVLNISGSDVTDNGLVHMQKLASIEELNISSCKVKELLHISSLTSLRKLIATDCYLLASVGIYHISTLNNLKHLNLSYCWTISDQGCLFIGNLVQLEELILVSCKITDTGLSHIASLSLLKHLDVSYCYSITNVGIAHIAFLRCLKELNVSYCSLVTESALLISLRELSVEVTRI